MEYGTENKLATAPKEFDWATVLFDSGMHGLTLMLARHTVVTTYDNEIPLLSVEIHEALQPIAQEYGIDDMVGHLKTVFGPSLQMRATFGLALESLAVEAHTQRVASMVDTMTTLMEDSFVADMAREFGAKVYIDSISKVDDAAKKSPSSRLP